MLPYASTVSTSPLIVTTENLVGYQHCAAEWSMEIEDQDGDPIDLSGKTLKFLAYYAADNTRTFQLQTGNGVAVSGANNNVVTITVPVARTRVARSYLYKLVNDTDDEMLMYGQMTIQEAPQVS